MMTGMFFLQILPKCTLILLLLNINGKILTVRASENINPNEFLPGHYTDLT